MSKINLLDLRKEVPTSIIISQAQISIIYFQVFNWRIPSYVQSCSSEVNLIIKKTLEFSSSSNIIYACHLEYSSQNTFNPVPTIFFLLSKKNIINRYL